VLIPGSSVLFALPPDTQEPGIKESYAMCAAVSELHIAFIERDLPLFGKNSNENEILKKNRRYQRKEVKRFEKKLGESTSEREAAELISTEKINILEALSTQVVEGDVLATDELRKTKLYDWYTDFCDSKR